MRFPAPLVRGRLVRRYKRFLADVVLDDGTAVTASCPNTGSMLGLSTPGQMIWLARSDSATRKYAHSWVMTEADLGAGPVLTGIDTGLPNRLVGEALAGGRLAELVGYAVHRREVKYGTNSRIDFLLEDPEKGLAYVEIKNVHLSREHGLAEFPDSVTERGRKHLGELAEVVRQGHRGVMLYLIQRPDAERFSLAADIDPAYAAAFAAAREAGVEAIAYTCTLSPEEVRIDRPVPLVP